jgi:hypothetical protein
MKRKNLLKNVIAFAVSFIILPACKKDGPIDVTPAVGFWQGYLADPKDSTIHTSYSMVVSSIGSVRAFNSNLADTAASSKKLFGTFTLNRMSFVTQLTNDQLDAFDFQGLISADQRTMDGSWVQRSGNNAIIGAMHFQKQ